MNSSKILAVLAVIATAQSAFAYRCQTTQAGTPTKIKNYCGTINANGTFSDGSTIYGTNRRISQEIKKYADGRTKVCVDACSVENDLQVYRIVSPRR